MKMKVTLTNQQMFDSLTVMARLSEKGKLAYAIMKNMKKLQIECESFGNYRDELIHKYAQDNGDGVHFDFKTAENKKRFEDELKSVAEEKFEVEVAGVTEDVFVSGNLDNQQMYTLDWMVRTDETDAPA